MHFSPILPEYEPYEEALYKGVQEGLIVPTDPALPFGPPDDFSHLLRKPGEQPGDSQGIDLELRNMRRIFPAAQVFLKYLVRMGKSARIMELGPGALRAATQTAQIFSDARIPVEIHTAGLTPASPFHALNYSFSDILSDRRGELARVIDSLPAGELRRSLQLTMDVTPLYSSLRLDAALAISDQFRPAIFSVLDKPFVDRQHIGNFSDAALDLQSYDFIYDDHGLCLHLAPNDDSFFPRVLSLLKPNGSLLFHGFPYSGIFGESSGESLSLSGVFGIVTNLSEGFPTPDERLGVCLLALSGSELEAILSPFLQKYPRNRNGLFLVPNVRMLLEEAFSQL